LYKIGTTDYYTVVDVAQETALARQTIDRYIKNGEINSPVARQHGKRTVRTYSKSEFRTVVNQIKNFPSKNDSKADA